MKTRWTPILIVSLFNVSFAQAETTQPDPSDLTQVNSFVFGTVDNQGMLKGMVGLAGQYSEDNTFMGLVEHNLATKTNSTGSKDNNTRLRYFQVLDVDSAAIKQAGFSVDYIRGWENTNGIGSDLVAIGTIAKVATPWEALSIYPNVAYVMGTARQDGSMDASLSGYQLNLFGSLSIGNWGQYAVFQPQYMHVSGDVDSDKNSGNLRVFGDVLQVKTGYGQPISKDGLWWVEASHTYTKSELEAKSNSGGIALPTDNDHKFEVGVAYYF
ncbi:hypothetical protein [Vibrio maritimus]|uniref:hypothetical protein n=1 Tax=Vibrio maritimus TaxID=990268 RepID=UPI001F3258E1|nr:hypothetical protein [Vibrio maritimus]